MARFPLFVLVILCGALFPSCQASPSPAERDAAALGKVVEEITFAELQLNTARLDYNSDPHNKEAARSVGYWKGEIVRLRSLMNPGAMYIMEKEGGPTPPAPKSTDQK